MKIIAQSGMRYIPTWRKNRKEPVETQMVIEWNYLSGEDREIVYGVKPIEFDIESGEMPKTISFKPDNINLLKQSIKSIIKFEIEANGECHPATIDDICKVPELGGLYRELTTFFTKENAETEKKN